MVYSAYGQQQPISGDQQNPAEQAMQPAQNQAPTQQPQQQTNQYAPSNPPQGQSNYYAPSQAPQSGYSNSYAPTQQPQRQYGYAPSQAPQSGQQNIYAPSNPPQRNGLTTGQAQGMASQQQNPALNALGNGNDPQAQKFVFQIGQKQPQYGLAQTPTQNAPPQYGPPAPQKTGGGGFGNYGVAQTPTQLQPQGGQQPTLWNNNMPAPPTNGPLWYPPAGYSTGLPGPQSTPQAPPSTPQSQASIETQALGGAGSNAQQTQNFLAALRQAGAGSNNAQMVSSGNATPQAVSPLLGSPAQNNGNAGSISYNYGLGAGGGNIGFQDLNPTVGSGYVPSNSYSTGPILPGLSLGIQPPSGQQFYADSGTLPGGMQPQPLTTGYGGSMQPTSGNNNPALAGLMSDETVKKNIRPGDETQSFLDSLTAYQYEYKNPKHGQGTHYSVMAQDLEKTPVGKSAIIETPEGKKVDYSRLQAVHLAATATLNDRIEKLEAKLNAKIRGK